MLILIAAALIIIFSGQSLFLHTFIIQTIFTVAVVFLFLVYYTLQGALANGELELHK